MREWKGARDFEGLGARNSWISVGGITGRGGSGARTRGNGRNVGSDGGGEGNAVAGILWDLGHGTSIYA